MNERADI